VSGDRESEVASIGAQLGITELFGGQSPADKVRIVREATALAKTLYVGDGINDAPALAAATVGVAFGRSNDVAAGDTGSANTFVRRVGDARFTTVFGEAVTRNGRRRLAPHRHEAHRHRSKVSSSGPSPLERSMNFSFNPSSDGGSNDTIQPPTWRPFKDTRTRPPMPTEAAISSETA
jgi:hypothetical protein